MKRVFIMGIAIASMISGSPVFATVTPGDALNKMLDDVSSKYYKTVDKNLLAEDALRGAMSALDPHSMYFNKSEYQEFNNSVEGKYVGIGILVGDDEKYVKVLKVYPRSPAEMGGVLAGDVLTAVDDVDLSKLNYQDRIDRILGEENTPIKITLIRNGTSITKNLIRKVIERNPIEYKVLDGKIGYISIEEFSANAAQHFNEALKTIRNQNVKGLVIDLRNNPGGLIDQVLLIAENLTPDKTPMIYVKSRTTEDVYTSEGKALGLPLTILVNGNSASGSEMLAGIVKDNKLGTLVGTKTYGKGTAQDLFPLAVAPGGGYKLTVAEFFTTSHISFNGKGITPDVVVQGVPFVTEDLLKQLAPLNDSKNVKLGDVGLNVYGVEQRLSLIGYSQVHPDGIYDETTYSIMKQLSLDTDGILTAAEAQKLSSKIISDSKSGVDPQLNKALEIIKAQIK